MDKKKNGLNTIMGARNNAQNDRQKEDFYATDPNTVDLFLNQIEKDDVELSHNIWECCCGMNHIVDVLRNKGYNVFATDIIDRNNSCDAIIDFLNIEIQDKNDLDILTNPPYKLQEQFVKHGLEQLRDGNKLILYLKIQFLEGIKRYDEIFSKIPPKYVYVHSSRQNIARDGDFETYGKGKANTICFIWCIWEKGFNGETILRWIR